MKTKSISLLNFIVFCFVVLISATVKADIDNCSAPDLPIIMGPLTNCKPDVDHKIHYYIDNPIAGATYSWSITGGTIDIDNNDNVDVTWTDVAPNCTLTVSHGDCTNSIFLQECDCPKPDDAYEVIDLDDRDWYTAIPSLYYHNLQYKIDPTLTHSNIVFGFGYSYLEVTNETILIRGEFNVNWGNVRFIGCTIYMDKGSIIYTPGSIPGFGMSFQNCTLQGICKYMWQGTRMRANGQLELDKTLLMDAEYGVGLNSRVTLNMTNSTFKENYVSIYAAKNSNWNSVDGNFMENDFDGGTLLPGRYNGQSYSGQVATNGLSPMPIHDQPFAAFELYDLMLNSTGVALPFSTTTGPVNYIHNLDQGIYANHCFMDVVNCSFENIYSHYYGSYGIWNGSGIYCYTDIAASSTVCHIGNTFSATNAFENTFFKVHRSIYLEGNMDSYEFSNNISDNNFIAIEIKNSLKHIHVVDFNVLRDIAYGIFGNMNGYSDVEVRTNDIISYLATAYYRYGIFISDGIWPSHTSVINNAMNIYSTIGIYGLNNINCLYRCNAVEMNGSYLPASTEMYGFDLTGGHNNTVFCNGVEGEGWPTNAYMSKRMRSFIFFDSHNNDISCNGSNLSYYGFEFRENSDNSNFYGNEIVEHHTGLLLGDPLNPNPALMGPQTTNNPTSSRPGNKFYGPFAGFATYTINSTAPTFWSSPGGGYNPVVNGTSGGSPFVPISSSTPSPYQCKDCTVFGFDPPNGQCEPGAGGTWGTRLSKPENKPYEKSDDYSSIIEKIYNNSVYSGRNKFTDDEKESINLISHLCPSDYGNVVFLARSLELFNNPTAVFDDNCGENLRKANNESINAYATLFPNPASNSFSFSYANKFSPGNLKVYNASGSIVMQKQISSRSEMSNINIEELINGIYICQFENSDGVYILGKLNIIK